MVERILLANILAGKSYNGLNLKAIRKFREDMEFTDEEEVDWGIKIENGSFRWGACYTCASNNLDVEKCQHRIKEFSIGSSVEKVIKDHFESLDKSNGLKLQDFDLVEKFCPHLFPDE
ncbi:hypothetical protein C4577_03670 [Candidatus Parcubacteria bacterium]|nr:MAG: hypothetical protein C4577_03670 [Candidatus Parcubacteria bacterium]